MSKQEEYKGESIAERKYTNEQLEEVERITKEYQEIQKAKKTQFKVSVLEFISTYGWAIAVVLIAVIVLLFMK